MPKQLIKGMYGHQFESKSHLFGLTCGQMRGKEKITHNSGWYNADGEKLGWGDLSKDDFIKIHQKIAEREKFIVLNETDSFWNFVTSYGPIGSMCATKPDEKAPGKEYIAKCVMYIIDKSGIYTIDQYGYYKHKKTWNQYGLQFKILQREEIKNFLEKQILETSIQ